MVPHSPYNFEDLHHHQIINLIFNTLRIFILNIVIIIVFLRVFFHSNENFRIVLFYSISIVACGRIGRHWTNRWKGKCTRRWRNGNCKISWWIYGRYSRTGDPSVRSRQSRSSQFDTRSYSGRIFVEHLLYLDVLIYYYSFNFICSASHKQANEWWTSKHD